MNLPTLKQEELNKNGKKHIIMGGVVFDITNYASKHPAGSATISKAMDTDGFKCLVTRHGRNLPILEKRLRELACGRLSQGPSDEVKQQMEEFEDKNVAMLFKKLFGQVK
ncbi:Cytochrome b5-like Heme/Steroid binding domain containing protein [Spironucleus salmonicida]|uniref:Cytochrome b5-like Heme/Steroid binding domain containing protein n=1 Tax=Spironucleus salmonicida TaxID=348837 RepID=V6LW25_9EUKA|nr:Cytochrome b5-like Heme/Steroid binding domain containing protein [Spironucleus salmonicida]|eukprot:EST45019.1 Cytochrome b5-like Heme/Steroid binding domain containing protein [Spironucleus salmonicida]